MEVDLKHWTWIIPANRMKGDREHRMPLAPRAVTILEQREIFGNPRSRSKERSDLVKFNRPLVSSVNCSGLIDSVAAPAGARTCAAPSAYVWRNSWETEEEALDRHYEQRPEDRSANQTLIFRWLGAG